MSGEAQRAAEAAEEREEWCREVCPAERAESEAEIERLRAQVEQLQAGRLGLGRLQLLRVFIEERAKAQPLPFMYDHSIRDFCIEVLKKVDSAGEPVKPESPPA